MHRTARVGLAALIVAQSACATVMGSKTADFSLNSQPEGATAVVDGQPVGTTPTQVKLSNTKEHMVTYTMPGYQSAGCTLTKSTGAGWVIGDIIPGALLGIIPIVVDAATGNWSQNTEHACMATLAPAVAAATAPAKTN